MPRRREIKVYGWLRCHFIFVWKDLLASWSAEEPPPIRSATRSVAVASFEVADRPRRSKVPRGYAVARWPGESTERGG